MPSNIMTTPARYPHFEEYMRYLAKDMGAARNTLNAYSFHIRAFFDWLLTSHKFNDVKHLTKTHISQYRDYLNTLRYRRKSIELKLRAVKSFLQFCVDFKHLIDSPFPQYINLRGKPAMPHLVPTPQEIFRIRLRDKVMLSGATLFELCLSTGMREGEVMQTYASDLNFEDRPFDMETKRPSQYFVGSILLKQTTHATKNSMPRKVYFSYMASILLKRHLHQNGIRREERVPIYPWSDSYLQDMIRMLGQGIIERNSSDLSTGNSTENSSQDAGQQRERGFTELDVNDLNVSEEFKKLIARRQGEEESIESYKRQASQPIRRKKRQLHPHALRHAFTNFCYYRSPLGTRQDEHNLRILMGHSGPTSTLSYLKTLPLIQDDTTWNRLWMGKPDDWMGINR